MYRSTEAGLTNGKQKRKAIREIAIPASHRRHTRSMTTDAARKAVFNTSELLEHIISFLPPKDVLTKIQRVSRQWKDAVEASPTVRSKLWMTLCKTPAVQSTGFTDEHIPGNPMWGMDARPMYSCALTLNSALLNRGFHDGGLHALRPRLEHLSLYSHVPDNKGVVWSFPTILFDCYLKNPFQQAGPALSPSWRSMYLTSPPITMVMLELHPGPSVGYGPHDIYLHLTNHTGITLGLLFDTIFARFAAQYGGTLAFDDVKHFWASLHFVSYSVSLGTSILGS